MGDIRKAHVLAEYPCEKCGGPCLRLTNANVLPDGRIDMQTLPAPVGLPVECNECAKSRRAKEAEEIRAYRKLNAQRKNWNNRGTI